MNPEIAQIVGQLGLPLALAVWFLWRDTLREKQADTREKDTIKRLRELEDSRMDEQKAWRGELRELLTTVLGTIKASTMAMECQARALARRPCIRDAHSTDDFTPHQQEPQP